MTSLPLSSLAALAPLIALVSSAILITTTSLWIDTWRFSAWLSVAVLVIVMALTLLVILSGSSTIIEGMLSVDGQAAVFALYVCGVGIATTFLELGARQDTDSTRYALLLLIVAGAIIVAQAVHLVPLAAGLFVLYVASTALLAPSAAFQHFLAHAISLACIVLGASMLYGVSGTLRINAAASAVGGPTLDAGNPLAMLGTGMLIAGLGLPLGIVPFHLVCRDIYTRSSSTRSMLVALGQPAAALAATSRMHDLWPVGTAAGLIILAASSILYGLWYSLRTDRISGVLYGVSMVQAGELLLCTTLISEADPTLLLYSLLAHGPISTVLWATSVNTRHPNKDPLLLSDLDGLADRRFWLAAVLTICLLSMAAVPPLAGAATKLYLGQAALTSGNLALVGLISFEVLGNWLLLGRFLVGMWLRPRVDRLWSPSTPEVAAVALISMACVLVLGLYAETAFNWLYYLIESSR
jgi:NADH-quinone oxidoreductase subunit N